MSSFGSVAEFEGQIRERIPDLALLDILLPDSDGHELCAQLRKCESTRKIPVILMSANTTPEVLSEASDFIPKPFDINDLVQRIEKQLSA